MTRETLEYLKASIRGGHAAMLECVDEVTLLERRIAQLEETVNLLANVIDVLMEDEA